jgi:hypothetical protein
MRWKKVSKRWGTALMLVSLLASVRVLAGDTGQISPQPDPLKWIEKVKLSGGFYGDFRRLDDPLLPLSPVSDLYLRMVELGISSNLVDWASAIIVLNSEWLGDSLNKGDMTLSIDEAYLDLQIPKMPIYATLGLRTQPFGQFESSMITEPLTQDGYETKKVGVTLGATGPLGLDASLTFYKGDELLSHFFASGLFDETAVFRPDVVARMVNSYVIALSAAPFTDVLHLGTAFSSEPGAGRRNETVNVFFSLNPDFLKGLSIDGEWMRALRREIYIDHERPFREGAFSLEISWVFNIWGAGLRPHQRRASFLARRSRRSAHPVAAFLRVENFFDDGLAAVSGSWSVKQRLGVGGRFTFSHSGSLAVYMAAEYLHETRRNAFSSDKSFFRLGLDF